MFMGLSLSTARRALLALHSEETSEVRVEARVEELQQEPSHKRAT